MASRDPRGVHGPGAPNSLWGLPVAVPPGTDELNKPSQSPTIIARSGVAINKAPVASKMNSMVNSQSLDALGTESGFETQAVEISCRSLSNIHVSAKIQRLHKCGT